MKLLVLSERFVALTLSHSIVNGAPFCLFPPIISRSACKTAVGTFKLNLLHCRRKALHNHELDEGSNSPSLAWCSQGMGNSAFNFSLSQTRKVKPTTGRIESLAPGLGISALTTEPTAALVSLANNTKKLHKSNLSTLIIYM